jgi:predicted SnoaL-like aldol condensation-catalyzing enzyme
MALHIVERLTEKPAYGLYVVPTLPEGDERRSFRSSLLRQGIHRGWLDVAPTGKPTTTSGIYIFRIEDGKIVEAWDAWDELGLLEQIGAEVRVEPLEEAGST